MSPSELDLRESLHADAERIDAPGDFAAAAISLERRRARRRSTIGAVAATTMLVVAAPVAWSNLAPRPAPATHPATLGSLPTAATGQSLVAPTATAPTSTASGVTSSTDPAPPAQASPSPTYRSNRAASPKALLRFGPRNGTPLTAYAVNGVFHEGDQTVKLPVTHGIRFVARLDGGGVLVYAPGTVQAEPLSFVSPSGYVAASFVDVQSVAVNDAGTRVATVDGIGTLRLRDAQGRLLRSLATKDPNVSVSALLGSSVYFSRVGDKGDMTTHVWNTATGVEEPETIVGRVVDVSEARSLAIVWPNQEYNPPNTCYQIVDLVSRQVRHTSCGEFAPSHFSPDGSVVVGPAVADGPGASSWLIASSDDASILLRVDASPAFAPSWRAGGKDSLVVALLDPDRSRRQVVASCAFDPLDGWSTIGTGAAGTCTVDSDPVAVSVTQREEMDWPITLSDN